MKLSEKITIIIGITLVGVFVIGLAWSISTGLAGFWRGLPFWVIVIFCLYLLVTDSLKELEELVPKNCVDHYSCSNGFVILQNAIKQIKLAGQ